MKKFTIITLLAVLAMLFAAVGPAAAQLGQTDFSSFTVQNVDSVDASVTVHFFDDDGVETTPVELNGGQTNPFDLAPGESFEVYVPGIPADELADGRYSVMIESTARVVTIANLIGSGSVNFNGSYSGFSESATTFYLPGVVFNFYGWYSLISAQNVGTEPADITLTITCEGGDEGVLEAAGIEPFASAHFVLKDPAFLPDGFTAATECNGSAIVASTTNIVVTDNQSVPTAGNTQSYSGVSAGSPTVFVPALYNSYFGWNASVNIQKLGAGAAEVTVEYSDGGTSDCSLDDAAPSCLLYMPAVHPSTGYFGATITSDGLPLMVIANAANGSQAQTYNGVGSGSLAVGIPSVMKDYYDWNTSFTCQNIGETTTTLEIEYDGFTAYDTDDELGPGDSLEVYTPGEAFLPVGHVGGATVTANEAGSLITCIVNFNNGELMGSTVGDWSMSYNAFNK